MNQFLKYLNFSSYFIIAHLNVSSTVAYWHEISLVEDWFYIMCSYFKAEIRKLRDASKNDKKKRKEALVEIDKLERNLRKKQQDELDEISKTEVCLCFTLLIRIYFVKQC